MQPSLDAWLAQTKVASPLLAQNGNTAWAQRYSQELREVVVRYADRLPRNVQRHLGPSELGHHCDRQLIGKMAGVSLAREHSNNLHDPWASIVGTAIHAFLEEAFKWETTRLIAEVGNSTARWWTERKVTPDPQSSYPHPGTADLYDAQTYTLNDHKCQSEGVRDKLRRNGPPHHYFMQMLLYAVGYMHEGYEVQRICLVSWPRTHSSLDDLFVWEHVLVPEDMDLVVDLIEKTEIREQLAAIVRQGEMDLFEIPATPSDSDCQYCPFFRPDAAHNPNVKGCPGTAGNKPPAFLVGLYLRATSTGQGYRRHMTDPNYSHLIFIVDRSGSMDETAEDATGGIHQTLKDLTIVPGKKTFSLYQFDTEHERLFHFDPLARGLTYTLKPRGGTALFDAIMEGTTREGETLAQMEEDRRPGKVVLAIVTDGGENASQEYSRFKGGLEKVKARLEEQQNKYSWQVTFIGANMDAISAGGDMGVAMASSLTYNQSHAGTRSAYKSFAGATSRYLAGASAGLEYTESERQDSMLGDDDE